MAASQTPRAILTAIYVWGINATFVILNEISPFQHQAEISVNWQIINSTAIWGNQTAVSGIGLFGLLNEFVHIINIGFELILGPFTLVPTLLDIATVTGTMRTIIIAAIWIPWALFLLGFITGRALKEIL